MLRCFLMTPDGKYDLLYERVPALWGTAPGRMVAQAAKITSAGRAIDIGAGDGKNTVFLESVGWTVDALDVSRQALHAFRRRCELSRHCYRGEYRILDAYEWRPNEGV